MKTGNSAAAVTGYETSEPLGSLARETGEGGAVGLKPGVRRPADAPTDSEPFVPKENPIHAASRTALPPRLAVPGQPRAPIPPGVFGVSRLILVTGGSRSGKSAFAQTLAEALPGPRVYVATCPVIDAEMDERIRLHREARGGRGWQTIEEPLDLAAAFDQARGAAVVLVDCLTLWINNVMYEAGPRGEEISEADITERCQPVIRAARAQGGTVLLVTNEVGMGLVPATPLGRRYRDLAGRANQVFGAACDEVYLVACGQPLRIKPQPFPNVL